MKALILSFLSLIKNSPRVSMTTSARHETGFGFRNRREDLGKLSPEECNLAYKNRRGR
jgi:hypothetical protein